MTSNINGEPGSLSAVVRQYYENIDRQDIQTALSCFRPDAVYHRPGYDAMLGLNAICAFYQEYRVISTGRHELESLIEKGEMVAVQGRFHGTLLSGETSSVRFADFWRFSDFLVVERDTYFDVEAV